MEMDLNDYIPATIVKNEAPKKPFSRDNHGLARKPELLRHKSAVPKVKYDRDLVSYRGEWLWKNNKPESHFKNYPKRPKSTKPTVTAAEA